MMKLTLYFALIYQLTQFTGGFITLGGINNLLWSPPSCIACFHNEASNYFSNLDKIIPRCAGEEINSFRRIAKMFFLAHICEYQIGTGFQSRYEELQTSGKIVLNKFKKCLKGKSLTNLGKEKLKEITMSFEYARKRCEDENFLEGGLKEMRKMYSKPASLQAEKKIKKPKYKKSIKKHYPADQAEELLKYSTGVAKQHIPTKAPSSNTPSEKLASDEESENNEEAFADTKDSFEDETQDEETTSETVSTPIAEIKTFEDQSTPLKTDDMTSSNTLDQAEDLGTNDELGLASQTSDNAAEVQNEKIDPENILDTSKNQSEPLPSDAIEMNAQNNEEKPTKNTDLSESQSTPVIDNSNKNDTIAEEIQDTEKNLENTPQSSENTFGESADNPKQKITAAEEIKGTKTNLENTPDSSENNPEELIEKPTENDATTEEIQDTKTNLENTLDSLKNDPEKELIETPFENDANATTEIQDTNSEKLPDVLENKPEELTDDPIEKIASPKEAKDPETNLKNTPDSSKNQSEPLIDGSIEQDAPADEIKATETNLENFDPPENKLEELTDNPIQNTSEQKFHDIVEENPTAEEVQNEIVDIENAPDSSENKTESLVNDSVEKNIPQSDDSKQNPPDEIPTLPTEETIKDSYEAQSENKSLETDTPIQVFENLNTDDQHGSQMPDAFASDAHDEEMDSEESPNNSENQSEPQANEPVIEDLPQVQNDALSPNNSENQSEPQVNEPVAEDLPQIQNDAYPATDTVPVNQPHEQSALSATDNQINSQENDVLVPLEEALIAAPVANAEMNSFESSADQITPPSGDTLVKDQLQIPNSTQEDGSESSSDNEFQIKSENQNAVVTNDPAEDFSKNDSLSQGSTLKDEPEFQINDTKDNGSTKIQDKILESTSEPSSQDSFTLKEPQEMAPEDQKLPTEAFKDSLKNQSSPLISDSSENLLSIPKNNSHTDGNSLSNNDTPTGNPEEMKSEEQVDPDNVLPSTNNFEKIKSAEEITPEVPESHTEVVEKAENNDSTIESNSVPSIPEIKSEKESSSINDDSLASLDNLAETKSEEIAPENTDLHTKEGDQIQKDDSIFENNSASSLPDIKSEEQPASINNDSLSSDNLTETTPKNETTSQITDPNVDHLNKTSEIEDIPASSLPEMKLEDKPGLITTDSNSNDELKETNSVETDSQTIEALDQIEKDTPITEESSGQSSSAENKMNIDTSEPPSTDISAETTSEVHENVKTPEIISETEPNTSKENVNDPSSLEPIEKISTTEENTPSAQDEITVDPPKDQETPVSNHKATEADNLTPEPSSSKEKNKESHNDQASTSSNDITPSNLNEPAKPDTISNPDDSSAQPSTEPITTNQSPIPTSSSENQNSTSPTQQSEPVPDNPQMNSKKVATKASVENDSSQIKSDANSTQAKQKKCQNANSLKDDTTDYYNQDDLEKLINLPDKKDDFKTRFNENPYIF